MPIETSKLSMLFQQVQNKDMQRVAGLNKKGQLADLGTCSKWNGRKVESTPDDRQSKQKLISYLKKQAEAVDDFNKKMGLPLSGREVEKDTQPPTFSALYNQLKMLIKTEAFAYERAKNKIDQYIKKPPTTPDAIKKQCNEIKKAINTCISYTENKGSKVLMLASLMGHAAQKIGAPDYPIECQKALINALNGMQVANIGKEPETKQATATSQHKTNKTEASPLKKKTLGNTILTIIHEFFARITGRKPVGKSHNFTPREHLARLKNTLKNFSPNSGEETTAVRTQVKEALHHITSFTKKHPYHAESVILNLMKMELKDKLTELDIKKAASKEKTPTIAQRSASEPEFKDEITQDIPAKPVTTPTVSELKTTKEPASPQQIVIQTPQPRPKLFIPKEVSLTDFKAIQSRAYHEVANNQKNLSEARAAVHHFVEAINKADYKAGNPKELKTFIERNKKTLTERQKNRDSASQCISLYKDIQQALALLETKSAAYLASELPQAQEPEPELSSLHYRELYSTPDTSIQSTSSTNTTFAIPEEEQMLLLTHLSSDKITEHTYRALKAFKNIKRLATSPEQKQICSLENFCLLVKTDEFIPKFEESCYKTPQLALHHLQVRINLATNKLHPDNQHSSNITPAPSQRPTSTSYSTQPVSLAAKVTPKRTYPARQAINALPLKNWGSTCFVNGYINYLMLSLDQEDIDALKQLNIDTQETNSNNILDPMVIQLRNAVVNLWGAFRQEPPIHNVEHLQRALLCAFTRCGNTQRSGNKKIPEFFANAFPHKSESQLNNHQVGFGNVKQEDVTELQVAMYDLLLSKIPERETILLNKTKTTNFRSQTLKVDAKSERQEGGFDIRVKNSAGKKATSMHAGLSALNNKFTSDEPINWEPAELQRAGLQEPPLSAQKLTTQIEDKLIISDDTEKFSVKVQPFHYNMERKVSEKLCNDAISIFEKDGNPLRLTLTNPVTKKTGTATFKPRCIVCHQGKTANSGHYFALSFQEDGRVIIHNDQAVGDLRLYLRSRGHDENMSVTDFLRKQDASPYIINYWRTS